MAGENRQALLDYDDSSQGQLRREEVGEGESQDSSLLNQKSHDSMKTMTTYGAADVARGAMGLAQGAANLAQGAATAMKNTFGNNSQNHNLHTPLPTANPQN